MSKVPSDFRIDGIIAAPATPMLPNGDINTPAIKEYVEYLAKNNISGVFVLGTLGEGASLTVSERKEVASAWVEYGKDRLSYVIVHAGAGNLRDSIELARHAQEIQATAVACMSTTYFKSAKEEDLVEYMEQVASAAPDLPFYYYCINFMTGVYLDTAKFIKLADGRIPNLRGIKISSPELPSVLDCTLVRGGKFDVLVGTDEQLLSTLTLGVRVPIVNGFLGNIFMKMRDAFDTQDWETAREQQILTRKIIHIRNKYGGGPACVKAFMKCLGLDLGPVRLPLKDVPADRLSELKQDLQDVGLPTA